MSSVEQLAVVAGGVLALALAFGWVMRRRRSAARPDLGAFLRRCGRRAEPGSGRPTLATASDLARYVASCPLDPRA